VKHAVLLKTNIGITKPEDAYVTEHANVKVKLKPTIKRQLYVIVHLEWPETNTDTVVPLEPDIMPTDTVSVLKTQSNLM